MAELLGTVRRALRVLDYLAESEAPVPIKQLAAELELNISSAYHVMNTLAVDGYVYARRADRRLRPGRQGGTAGRRLHALVAGGARAARDRRRAGRADGRERVPRDAPRPGRRDHRHRRVAPARARPRAAPRLLRRSARARAGQGGPRLRRRERRARPLRDAPAAPHHAAHARDDDRDRDRARPRPAPGLQRGRRRVLRRRVLPGRAVLRPRRQPGRLAVRLRPVFSLPLACAPRCATPSWTPRAPPRRALDTAHRRVSLG